MPISGENRGIDRELVLRQRTETLRGIIANLTACSSISFQILFSSLTTSTIVNLTFSSPRLSTSIVLASITFVFTTTGFPAVVTAVTLTFLLRRLCLIVNDVSAFSWNVRSNFLGFSFER